MIARSTNAFWYMYKTLRIFCDKLHIFLQESRVGNKKIEGFRDWEEKDAKRVCVDGAKFLCSSVCTSLVAQWWWVLSSCLAGDTGSIPGLRRSPEEDNGNPGILVWEIPWTEESGKLQSMALQKSQTQLCNYTPPEKELWQTAVE